MINHVRTLFLNRSGTPRALTSTPGEEFVDPNFIQRVLPVFLRAPMQTLFGSNPDRTYLNYRLRQVMQMLHQTELNEDILSFDKRLTYFPFENDEFVDEVFNVEVNRVAGRSKITITGEHVGDSGPGITRQQWNVSVESIEDIKIIKRVPPTSETFVTYDATIGRTQQIPLPGTGLKFEIQAPRMGNEWEIYSTGRPDTGLETLLPAFAAGIGAVGTLNLFTVSPPEPLLTYRNLWLENPLFAYKYGGLLLAVVSLIDKAPQVQQ